MKKLKVKGFDTEAKKVKVHPQKARIIKLRKTGLSLRAIGRVYGKSYEWVRKIIR